MNLQEAIIEGKNLIQVGKLNGEDTHRIEEKVREIEQRQLEIIETENKQITLETINGIKISEFKMRNLAVEIYSEILNENIWFCSNTDMAKQIKGDDPTAICYTADELQKIIELNPSEGFLKKIHDTKTVFENSKIIKTIDKKKTNYD